MSETRKRILAECIEARQEREKWSASVLVSLKTVDLALPDFEEGAEHHHRLRTLQRQLLYIRGRRAQRRAYLAESN